MRAHEMAHAIAVPLRSGNGFHPSVVDYINSQSQRCVPRLVLASRARGERNACVSIQASEFHHCSPRKNLPWHMYDTYELGFPTGQPKLLDPYGEYDPDTSNNSGVYNNVPADIVQQYIDEQGGIVGYRHNPRKTGFVKFALTDEEISFYILNNG